MRTLSVLILIVLFFCSYHSFAHIGPKSGKKNKEKSVYRNDCAESRGEVDMEINNVRVRLQTGGDLFYDFTDGRYIVPKRDPSSGIDEVSSLYAGAVWLGGVLQGENPSLKIACQDYRVNNGVDYYPGPLRDEDGDTDAITCRQWDRFFRVRGDSIKKHLRNVEYYRSINMPYPPDKIPEDLKKWPAVGNPYFNKYYDFELPSAIQGLGDYWDDPTGEAASDGVYDPADGDFPRIRIKGCEDEPQFADDMYFWVYNDAGNVHEVTEGTKIRMEVQVQAFAYKTQDEINNMTFYRYKLINRAAEPIDSTFFAMWIDPDLGCPDDDFIGCDTATSMMYVYNQDAIDGISDCDCSISGGIIPTYCEDVPILGIDYFRGPISEPIEENGSFVRKELGMTSFTYYNRGASNPPPETTDPEVPIEYYRLLNGYWKYGTPLTKGGSGYLEGMETTNYAFPSAPDDGSGWSMCSATSLNFDDRRTLQTTGPFRLDPGDVKELIIGVVWLPEADYPCPSIDPLLRADQTAQGLFDNCFELLEGPDAPTLCPLELDQEIIFTLVNRPGGSSNNPGLSYKQTDPKLKGLGIADSQYVFEGYRIYQLANANVKAVTSSFEDITKAREILSYDIENDITKIYNWESIGNPFSSEPVWAPKEKVDGANKGIKHSLSVNQDAFASGEDTRLINFKKYYFAVIAYAHNNFDDFDVNQPAVGQRTSYIVGRNNVTEYIVVPRKTAHVNINSLYGDGLIVTRLDGEGVVNNTLMITDETREEIVKNNKIDRLTWAPGGSPLNAKIYDPANVKNGSYIVSFDNFEGDPSFSRTHFRVEHTNSGKSVESESTLDVLNEELIHEFGFSVSFNQGTEPGTMTFADESNGFLGAAMEYADLRGPQWYSFVSEGLTSAVNFVKTDNDESKDYLMDPNQVFTRQYQTGFYPFLLMAYDTSDGHYNPENDILYSPTWFSDGVARIRTKTAGLSNLNNVDIVFTSNKELWSKCIVVQSANYFFKDYITDHDESMDLLLRPSVAKEAHPNNPLIPNEANDGTFGYSYFPGYAVDVESGKRLNIFFGENTAIHAESSHPFVSGRPQEMLTGDDRMWNPNVNDLFQGSGSSHDAFLAGGQHYIFVTDLEYDGCELLHDSLVVAANRPRGFSKIIKQNLFKFITWSGFPVQAPNQSLLSYEDGLIPNDLVINLRVKNQFQRMVYSGENDGFNQYEIKIEGKEATTLNSSEIESALDLINVVPNPYYAYSLYENSATDNIVKITNLPKVCKINIYSLDGKFIKKYDRNAQSNSKPFANAPIPEAMFGTDVEWDLKNHADVPIASGVYFIHVKAPGLGERVIKWFGTNRKFDPSAID